jgi:hypothetical protein
MRVANALSPGEAKRQNEKGLVRSIKPFLQLLEMLAELLDQDSDDLIYSAFKDTSFGQSHARVENDVASDLNYLLHEMIRSVIRSEELAQYFSKARRAIGFYDPAAKDFFSGCSAVMASASGYDKEFSEIWSAPPFPAVPLLRIQRMQFSGPLRFEKRVLAPKTRLAAGFDLQRAGNLIQGAASHGLLIAKRQGLLEKIDEFWVAVPSAPIVPRDRSVTPLGSGVRRPELIAPAEFQAAARIALESNLALIRDDLTTEVARLLGFARTGRDLAATIGLAIDALLSDVAELDHLGRVHLRDDNGSVQSQT